MENKKVFIADDTAGIPELYRCFLEGEFIVPVVIEIFKNGTSLEKRLGENPENLRLVLTDNQMPGITGSEIISKYSRMPQFSNARFVLLTGDEYSVGEEAVRNGAYGYLIKPFDFKDLIRIAKDAFRQE